MSIFKAYDIRGIYPTELDEHVAYRIGAAFGTLNPGTIAVGCDTRLSSPVLKDQFIKGVCSSGSDVVDIGMVTTPIIVFAVNHLTCDGGVTITASHNPKEYNGFKLYNGEAMPISYESGIAALKDLVERGEFRKGIGSSSTRPIKSAYIASILSKVNVKVEAELGKPLSVVIDGSNGVAGLYAPEIMQRLGIQVHKVNCTPDGTFPGHEPDPTKPENLVDAQIKIKETGADIGFVYDGDGDRMAVIDEAGNAIESRRIFALLAQHVLAEKPGVKIVHDALMSSMAIDTIQQYGGFAVPCRVGHTYIAQKMKEEAAELGGELSGHYYFKEAFFADDAILASLKVLELVAREGRKISTLVKDFPKYFSENLRVPVRDVEKFSFIAQLRLELEQAGYLVDALDGVKVVFDHGWALFRASHTEPKLSIAYESRYTEEFKRIKDFVDRIIERVPQEQ
jgi:phosphomannomutase/phosphoglucomutase